MGIHLNPRCTISIIVCHSGGMHFKTKVSSMYKKTFTRTKLIPLIAVHDYNFQYSECSQIKRW